MHKRILDRVSNEQRARSALFAAQQDLLRDMLACDALTKSQQTSQCIVAIRLVVEPEYVRDPFLGVKELGHMHRAGGSHPAAPFFKRAAALLQAFIIDADLRKPEGR